MSQLRSNAHSSSIITIIRASFVCIFNESWSSSVACSEFCEKEAKKNNMGFPSLQIYLSDFYFVKYFTFLSSLLIPFTDPMFPINVSGIFKDSLNDANTVADQHTQRRSNERAYIYTERLQLSALSYYIWQKSKLENTFSDI